MEKKIYNLFEDMIKLWRMAEETVINDRGTSDDYDLLEEEETRLRQRLDTILNKLNNKK